jgi:hypothetical protein
LRSSAPHFSRRPRPVEGAVLLIRIPYVAQRLSMRSGLIVVPSDESIIS